MNPRNTGILLLTVLLLCAVGNIPAVGNRENKEGSKPVKVKITGTVRMVGNVPVSSLVISGEGREWQVEPSEEAKLKHLQQQTVTVSGKEYYIDYVFTFGSATKRQYFIKDITVISPD